MKPYSLDLRERVLARVAAGAPVRAVAAAFDVSVSSVVKWSQRWRATGSAAARPMGGKRREVMASARDCVLARLAEEPSLALRALQAELAGRGVKVSCGAVWRLVHREGLSHKKGRSSPKRSSARKCPPPRPLEAAPAPDRPLRSRLH